MESSRTLLENGLLSASGISRGIVREVFAGALVVVDRIERADSLLCDVLQADNRGLILLPDDEVLVWSSGQEGERGVVLGRVGGTRRSDPDAPDSLLLEAKQELTLRVGDGSITIRADGKILIKGSDLVSHATRINRIKGGAVAIN